MKVVCKIYDLYLPQSQETLRSWVRRHLRSVVLKENTLLSWASYLIGKYGEDKLSQRSIDIGKTI